MINRGKFLVLEGVDGVGKTTLAEEICRDSKFVHVKRKQVSQINEFIDSQMLKHNKLLWTENYGADDHLLPPSYWITLQAAWYILLTNFVITPELEKGNNVIVDGWYYKLKARLKLQNEDMNYVENIFKPIMKPDEIILLNVDVNEIWNRKKEFRTYEFGKFKDAEVKEQKESFIEYQDNTFRNLVDMKEANWKEIDLNGLSIEESKNKILKIIEE